LGGEGLPIGLVIFVVVVVVVGGGKVGLGALPNVLSALLEVPSLSARSSSTSHFRTHVCNNCVVVVNEALGFGVGVRA
jgi:hypothetical protein